MKKQAGHLCVNFKQAWPTHLACPWKVFGLIDIRIIRFPNRPNVEIHRLEEIKKRT